MNDTQKVASVPAELIKRWQHEAWIKVTGDLEQLIYIAERAATYGREQAQQAMKEQEKAK